MSGDVTRGRPEGWEGHETINQAAGELEMVWVEAQRAASSTAGADAGAVIST